MADQIEWMRAMIEAGSNAKQRVSIQMFLIGLVLAGAGCVRHRPAAVEAGPSVPGPEAVPIAGYAIQVGAFSHLDNAVRLTRTLIDQSLDAFYFKHDSGLFKVRFGDFATKEKARAKAEGLKSSGIIAEYFIVSPESLPVSQASHSGPDLVREHIVNRALGFLGLPYRWGGIRPEEGFDCSGLTMAVYHLVGLNLPHSSRSQFSLGMPVSKRDLKKGDLVFFRTSREGRISHVGIYTGNGGFVHAPGENQRIRLDSLSDRYFQDRYAGARTYLSRLSRDRAPENNKN
jgi:hypothetical protein